MSVYQFTVDDLRERYGCKSDIELANLLGWSKGPSPYGEAMVFQLVISVF